MILSKQLTQELFKYLLPPIFTGKNEQSVSQRVTSNSFIDFLGFKIPLAPRIFPVYPELWGRNIYPKSNVYYGFDSLNSQYLYKIKIKELKKIIKNKTKR